MRRNLERLGLTATIVAADATQWQAPPFDAVLLDAPCSSTGTIRRHPDVPWRKRAQDIAALTAVQRALLARAIELTRRGGHLIYCVCSLEPEEGPRLVADLLAEDPRVARKRVDPAAEVGDLPEVLLTPGRRAAHAAVPAARSRPAPVRPRRLLRGAPPAAELSSPS